MSDFGSWFPTIEKQNLDLQEESRFTTEAGLPSPPIQIPTIPTNLPHGYFLFPRSGTVYKSPWHCDAAIGTSRDNRPGVSILSMHVASACASGIQLEADTQKVNFTR